MAFCLKRTRVFLLKKQNARNTLLWLWIVSLVLGTELNLLLALNKHHTATGISHTGKTLHMSLVFMQKKKIFFSGIRTEGPLRRHTDTPSFLYSRYKIWNQKSRGWTGIISISGTSVFCMDVMFNARSILPLSNSSNWCDHHKAKEKGAP